MSETIKIEKSSGNVFLDIGFPEEEAEYLLLRTDLAFEVHRALDTRKLSRTKIAELLGLSPEEVAHLMEWHLDAFSVEQLFTFLNRLNHNVEPALRLRVEQSAFGALRFSNVV